MCSLHKYLVSRRRQSTQNVLVYQSVSMIRSKDVLEQMLVSEKKNKLNHQVSEREVFILNDIIGIFERCRTAFF